MGGKIKTLEREDFQKVTKSQGIFFITHVNFPLLIYTVNLPYLGLLLLKIMFENCLPLLILWCVINLRIG